MSCGHTMCNTTSKREISLLELEIVKMLETQDNVSHIRKVEM